MTNFLVPNISPEPFKTTAEELIPLPILDPQNSSLPNPEETKSPASTYSGYPFQGNMADTPCVSSSMDRDGIPYQPIDCHDHSSTRPTENGNLAFPHSLEIKHQLNEFYREKPHNAHLQT